jgi:glyoxylase-like metal-dependent hydrolase (beta-lactamase superfamily II)
MTQTRELLSGIQLIVCGEIGPTNNIYLIRTDEGLTMVDAGWLGQVAPIMEGLRELGWQPEDLKLLLLTHHHPDHYGGASGIVQLTGAKVASHELDAAVISGQKRIRMLPRPLRTYLIQKLGESQGVTYPTDVALWQPPPVKVDRLLRDGDMLGEWQVIHSPGHTPGNISLHNATRKVLIVGNWLMGAIRQPRRRGPLAWLLQMLVAQVMDFAAMRASARRLAALDFETLLLSHLDPAGFPEIAERLKAQFAAGNV